ncbi:MAG: HAD family hydrolase [Rhodoblastus sp.]|nr:MAG: HAD family hydrolase [Rhodoblastus sp.]
MARVIADFAQGDAALAERLAAAILFEPATARFPDASPFVAGTTQDFAAQWAQLLHRPAAGFASEIDAALGRAVLATLAPIGDLRALFDALRARPQARPRHQRRRRPRPRADGGARARRQARFHRRLRSWLRRQARARHGAGLRARGRRRAGEVGLVGDSRHDLETARAAGAVAIGVLSGPASRASLEPLADYLLPDISALPTFLSARG